MEENENKIEDEILEQPRDKMERLGPASLTDKELIMVLIGSNYHKRPAGEIAEEVLARLDRYPESTMSDLRMIKGMGPIKASLVEASLELGRRRIQRKPRTIVSPKDIFKEVLHFASREQEHFIIVMLNGAYEVIGSFVSTIGLVNRALVHPREVFAPAIEKRASAIALAHNHPSGSLMPSDEDKEVTRRISKAGMLLGIKVIDHVVFTEESYYSFLEHSLM